MPPVMAGTSGGRLVLGAVLLVLVLVTGPGGVWCVQHYRVEHQYGLLFPCKRHPQYYTPEDVKCDGGSELTIRPGDVPTSVSRLSVANYHTVTVDAGALETMKYPGSVLFENIENLFIQGRSLPDPRNHPFEQLGPIYVTINNIGYVELGTGSLSHWLTIDASITNVNTCRLYNAITSSSIASSVRLNNITDGQFYPGTFGTTLGTLSLTNVTVNVPCQNRTFSGSIGRLSLKRVQFVSVSEGCFDASRMWKGLSVLSSYLGDIDERGIHGRIEDVSFQETNFGRIKPRGIELNVTRLTMDASSVLDLSGYGLSVRASDTILIQKSVISEARKNAFHGLTLTTQNRHIQLSQLVLGKSSEGFLRVSDINAVDLKDIYVDVPCRCDIRRLVCQNFYHPRCQSPLSEDEKTMRRLAFRNIRCVDGSTNPYMLVYHCLNCDNPISICKDRDRGAMDSDDRDNNDRDSDAVKGDAKTNNTSSAGGASSLTWLVVIPVCLVIGAGVAVLAIRRRRRSLPPRRRPPREGRPPSQRLTSADLRHPLPDLSQDTTRRDGGESAVPPSGGSAGPKLRPDTGDDSLYESLPEPRPDSCEYEDLTNFRGSPQQGLYEEPPSSEKKQSGTKTAPTSKPPTCEPLYAEVHKEGINTAKPSGTRDDLNSPNPGHSVPLYAQVHKARNRTGDPASEWTSDSASAPKSPRAVDMDASATMTEPPDDGATAMPVYAQVIKGRGRKDRNEHRAIGEPDVVETETANDGSAVYASVIKHKLGRSHSQAEGHPMVDIPPEETAVPAAGHEAPDRRHRRASSESLYEDGRSFAVGERPMQEDHPSTPGERGQQNLGVSSRRDGPPRGRVVESPGAARLAAAGQENPLYAGTQTPVPSPDDTCGSGDPGENLQYNSLYESHQW